MKSRFALLAIFGTLVCQSTSTAQAPWEWSMGPGAPVYGESGLLPHPFTGGLSAPQWSEIDLDWDGDNDLFSFDRDGNRILAFEQLGPGDYRERPEWAEGWPAVKHWVLLRDFDCDGLVDLFTGYQNGIHVWRNVSTSPGVPQFEPFATPLLASWDFGTGAQDLPVVCLTIDKPAIFDVDEDGDLDIICFTETSTTLYRFSGQSACGLDLVCTNRCYGMFSEGAEDNSLFIGEEHNCGFNVVDPEGRPADEIDARDGVHAGGAITAVQADGEFFHDLLISDVTYPTMSALFLEDAADGQDSTAWVDHAFPALVPHAGPADSMLLPRFPAAYPIDPDADGDWDLVVSPNIALEIDDDRCVQLWENQGDLENPIWALTDDNWIQRGMIDVGRGAVPHLADLDGDGDLDLLIGNKERYEGVNATPTALALFRNTGSDANPEFTWMTWSAIDFATNGIESAFPSCGDWDGDGDQDLIVGDELGLLHLYENTAGPNAWPEWEMVQLAVSDNDGNAIDVGQFASPQLIDVDSDGLLDLVVGEKNGTLSLFLNCGSAVTPDWCLFESAEFGENFGGIQVENALGINGYSTPALLVLDGTLHVFVGNELGNVEYFGVVNATALDAPLTNQSHQVNGNQQGIRAAAALGDVNADGFPELLVGMQNGGIRWYNGIATELHELAGNSELLAFPNPVQAGQSLQLGFQPESMISTKAACTWFDQCGRELSMPMRTGQILTAPTNPGIYVVRVQTPNGTAAARVVVTPKE